MASNPNNLERREEVENALKKAQSNLVPKVLLGNAIGALVGAAVPVVYGAQAGKKVAVEIMQDLAHKKGVPLEVLLKENASSVHKEIQSGVMKKILQDPNLRKLQAYYPIMLASTTAIGGLFSLQKANSKIKQLHQELDTLGSPNTEMSGR